MLALGLSPAAHADFKDVERWSELGIATAELQEQGIIEGFGGNVFLPDKAVSRAAFTKMVSGVVFSAKDVNNCLADSTYYVSQQVAFRDVPVSEWFAPYVCVAKKRGLVNGYPDQTFRPGQDISYAEAAKIIVEGIGKKTAEGGEWYEQYWNALADTGALEGIPYRPFESITRADTALILYRLFYTQDAPYSTASKPSPVARASPATTTAARASPAPTVLTTPVVEFVPPALPAVDWETMSCNEIVAAVFPPQHAPEECFRNEQYDPSRQRCTPS